MSITRLAIRLARSPQLPLSLSSALATSFLRNGKMASTTGAAMSAKVLAES